MGVAHLSPPTCFLIKFKGMILLLSSLLIKVAFAANPAEDLQKCLQTNSVLDDCLKEVLVNMASNSIKLSMVFEEMQSTGKYTVTVLGTSSGPYNNTYSAISVDAVAKLMKKGNTVQVDDIDMKIAVGQIKVQLKCLFPKEDTCPSPDSFSLEEMKGSAFAENCCCPQNTDKGENMSCTPLLAKTTHRTINKSGRGNLVERFQPQITGSVGGLVKNYLNGSFRQVDASVFF